MGVAPDALVVSGATVYRVLAKEAGRAIRPLNVRRHAARGYLIKPLLANYLAPYAGELGPRGPEAAEGRVTAIAACRTCGTEPLENARFCHSWGSPVNDTATRAEYKQVTVLFAELVIRLGDTTAPGCTV